MTALVDVLIPSYSRPPALSVTMASLVAQTFRDFRVVVSEQNDVEDVANRGDIQAISNVLAAHGHIVEIYKHLPRRGMAEQRQFLLEHAEAPYSLYLDDDLILEPWLIESMFNAIQEAKCGFVGSAVIGLTHINDIRPHEQSIEFWDGPVTPEVIRPYMPEWIRHKVHNAANIYHVQTQRGAIPEHPQLYRVAWVGGCVMYDTEKLRQIGGYRFWRQLPPLHAGEDVLAQLRVMARFGGAGMIPSGAYHMQLPTTIPHRPVDAPYVLAIDDPIPEEATEIDPKTFYAQNYQYNNQSQFLKDGQ